MRTCGMSADKCSLSGGEGVGDGVPVEGVRGLLFHQHMKVWACHPGVRAEFPDASLYPADILLSLCCSGSWVCIVCACMHVCLCVRACVHVSLRMGSLSHTCRRIPSTVPFPVGRGIASPTLVAVGAAGPRMGAHLARVAFHSYALIHVCPLPALSRGILVTPGIRLTPSS